MDNISNRRHLVYYEQPLTHSKRDVFSIRLLPPLPEHYLLKSFSLYPA